MISRTCPDGTSPNLNRVRHLEVEELEVRLVGVAMNEESVPVERDVGVLVFAHELLLDHDGPTFHAAERAVVAAIGRLDVRRDDRFIHELEIIPAVDEAIDIVRGSIELARLARCNIKDRQQPADATVIDFSTEDVSSLLRRGRVGQPERDPAKNRSRLPPPIMLPPPLTVALMPLVTATSLSLVHQSRRARAEFCSARVLRVCDSKPPQHGKQHGQQSAT
jgi:hypothetical protein